LLDKGSKLFKKDKCPRGCSETMNSLYFVKGKDKGHPITAHEGPRGGIEV
jgi:hypothetical protein